jgi:hypothetical protein
MTAFHYSGLRDWLYAVAAMGHEDQFPSTRLNAGYGFRKKTIPGERHKGRDTPTPDLPALALERAGSTQSRRRTIPTSWPRRSSPEGSHGRLRFNLFDRTTDGENSTALSS